MFSTVAKPILFLLRHSRTLTILTWCSSISATIAAIAGGYNETFNIFDFSQSLDQTPALSITAFLELVRRAIREKIVPALNKIATSDEPL